MLASLHCWPCHKKKNHQQKPEISVVVCSSPAFTWPEATYPHHHNQFWFLYALASRPNCSLTPRRRISSLDKQQQILTFLEGNLNPPIWIRLYSKDVAVWSLSNLLFSIVNWLPLFYLVSSLSSHSRCFYHQTAVGILWNPDRLENIVLLLLLLLLLIPTTTIVTTTIRSVYSGLTLSQTLSYAQLYGMGK